MSRPVNVIDPAFAAAEADRFIPRPNDDDLGVARPKSRGQAELSALDLEKIITLTEAAAFTGLSKDSLRRHHKHLFRRLSPKRIGIKLKDALTIGEGA
jgi:hypothetical protein